VRSMKFALDGRAWMVLTMLAGCASENRSSGDVPDATAAMRDDRGAATINDGATDTGITDARSTDAGSTDATSCAAGRASCAGACVDLTTDGANCGACGRTCDASEVCGLGACALRDPAAQRSCEPTPVAGCGRLRVVGGTFSMGHEGLSYGASPVLDGISVSDYYLDTHEVTVARFRRFWDGGHPVPGPVIHYPEGVELHYRGFMDPGERFPWRVPPGAREDHPMNLVNWATAQAFCVWDGGRLPTEAELEFAGATSANLFYPWGEDPPSSQLCWSVPMRRSVACPVGSFPATRGFYDLVGNVWEWAADEWIVYPLGCWSGAFRRRNPLCTGIDFHGASTQFTIRGGSWDDDRAPFVTASARMERDDSRASYNIGFRCASSPR